MCCDLVQSILEGRRKRCPQPFLSLRPPGGDRKGPQVLPALWLIRGVRWLQEAVLSRGSFSRSNVLFEEMCLLGTGPF